MDRTDFEPWKGKEVAKLLALVENQRRYYQDLISALPVGLVVLSANRSVVSSNRAFRQAFGVRSEDLRGKNIEQILPSDRLIENIRNTMVNGIPQPALQLEHAGKLWRIAILPLRNWDEEMEMETLLVVDDVTGLPVGRSRGGAPNGFAFRQRAGGGLARRRRGAPVHGRQRWGGTDAGLSGGALAEDLPTSLRSGFTRRIVTRCWRCTGRRFSNRARSARSFAW